MANQQNKGIIIGIAVAVVVVIAIVVGIVVAKTSGGNGSDTSSGDNGGAETEQVDNNGVVMDLSEVDASIDFGDYDAMYKQAKAIQDGDLLGAVIKIDGIVSHPMSKYSIVEKDENGSAIGTEFIIEGIEESDYPQDGDRIIITGQVIEKEPLYFVIATTPQYVETFESTSEIEE